LTETKPDARFDVGVADPLGALATAGKEVDGPAIEDEPQLDRARLTAPPADRRQPRVGLVGGAGLDLVGGHAASLPACRRARLWTDTEHLF
jgi:hypothetical protein